MQNCKDARTTDGFIEEVLAMDHTSKFTETHISKLKSDSRYIAKMEEFKARLREYESREWDEEQQEMCMDQIDIDAILMLICRTGPFDLNSNEAVALMNCAGLISRSDPPTAAKILAVLDRWTNRRRHDPLRIDEFLTRTMFEEVLRWSLDGKLHFRSDYGETIPETLRALQKRSKFFYIGKFQMQETITTILQRLKYRKHEFILNALLRTWYLYCEQDETELDFFRSAYLEFCSRFMSNKEDTLASVWDVELLKIREHNPLGVADLYQHDPLEDLGRWAAEDDIGANERFHRSSKPISDADSIDREFNPTVQNQCIRELCLMAAFDVCDPRTADVFRAIKSLGIGDLFEKMYLEEWCSRHPSYAGPESVRKLLCEAKPYSPSEALDILHAYRCEHPVLLFRANPPFLETSQQEDTKRAGNTLQVENKKKRKTGAQAEEKKTETSDDLTNEETKGQEQEEKAVSTQFLYKFLHRVDVQRSSWACVLSVAWQLHPGEKEEILEFIKYYYKIKDSDLEKCWDAKRGNCLDWGHFLKQHIDVMCSGFDLIKKTLPAVVGSNLLMFGILDRQGCKLLRFVPDVVPFKVFDLNLSTGLINGDEKLNLNLVKSIADCSDYMLSELLIEQGINSRLGFFQDDYYQYNNQSGAWHSMEKDQAQSVTSKVLTILFSRTLDLIRFRESVGLYSVPAATMSAMMRKYSGGHTGVVEVLKALRSKIRFEPPEEKPYLACFANGLVDLRSKTLLGPAKPSDYVIRSIPHPYDPEADQSLVVRYIQSFFPDSVYADASDMREFHKKHLGSFITKVKGLMPGMILFVGEGSNGKSDYCSIIRKALGREYHSTIAAEALEKAPGTNNDNLHRARFARCTTISEVEKTSRFHAKTTKNLTGGDETEFNAKFIKGSAEVTELKMHIFCNDIPAFTAKIPDDFALGRRLAVVPMRVQFLDDNDQLHIEKMKNAGQEHWIFPKDRDLVAQLLENGIPGLLAYMVDGAAKLFADGCKLALPPTIWTATNQVKSEDADELIRDFVGTQLTRAAGLSERTFISTEEMTEVYRKLHSKESCLLKSGPFATSLKSVIADTFIKQQVEGRDVMVVDSKKKGAPSPLGPRELRGYFNLVWKKDSDGAVEATKLRKTYATHMSS